MNRKVKFLDSETEMGKQLTLFENEMANLQKIRHVNLGTNHHIRKKINRFFVNNTYFYPVLGRYFLQKFL